MSQLVGRLKGVTDRFSPSRSRTFFVLLVLPVVLLLIGYSTTSYLSKKPKETPKPAWESPVQKVIIGQKPAPIRNLKPASPSDLKPGEGGGR